MGRADVAAGNLNAVLKQQQKQQQKTMNIKQLKESSGLMSCLFDHSVSETRAKFKWDGPKLSVNVWNEVLAFFRWTHEEHDSESQVRFFVNKDEWRAWAFPQKARTGSSAQEIDTDTARQQRAMFPDTDGWLYWGTAHHHLGMGAFQSGTDEENEKNQDGLHITVGKLGDSTYDLHTRLYISGFKLTHDMSWFWETHNVFNGVPARFLKPDAHHELAIEMMKIPPPKDQTFPNEWRENVIEIKPEPMVVRHTYQGGLGFQQSGWSVRNSRRPSNYRPDLRLAAIELGELLEEYNVGKKKKKQIDAIVLMREMADDDLLAGIADILYRNDVSPDALHEYLNEVELDDNQKYISGEPLPGHEIPGQSPSAENINPHTDYGV